MVVPKTNNVLSASAAINTLSATRLDADPTRKHSRYPIGQARCFDANARLPR
jgi:hypothetical protein